MHDVARPAAEDRVELVLAGGGEALAAAVFEARKPVAVVPAPRPLADVAGQGGDVADLWRAHAVGGLRQDRRRMIGCRLRDSSVARPPILTPIAVSCT